LAGIFGGEIFAKSKPFAHAYEISHRDDLNYFLEDAQKRAGIIDK